MFSPSISVYAGVGFAALVLYLTARLLQNFRTAKQTGLPVVITPLLETEALALLLTPILRLIYERRVLAGHGWPRWCRLIVKDWCWEDKRAIHDEYGDVFIAVSSQGLICYSADASMGWDVMNRRQEFTKPKDKYKLLKIYGENVATAEGKVYQHHLRITAPPFGDGSGANDLVWDETLRQTRHLVKLWGKGQDFDPEMDVNALTLSVISRAGLGKPIDIVESLNHDDSEPPEGYKLTFLKAINDTTRHMVAILLFPRWLLQWSPRADAALAHQELDKHMRSLLREERYNLEKNRDHESTVARGNLLTSVVRNSLADLPGGQKTTGKGFTEDEVMGNLFIYLLAGYETTANAILYGLVTLALNPHIQRKMCSEIDQTCNAARDEGRSELNYADDFAKLEYCYGVMYESFRLYPGVPLITKVTETGTVVNVFDSQSSNASPRQHRLPAECRVYLNVPAIHYSPRYWQNPWELRPERWMTGADATHSLSLDSSNKKVLASDKTRQMKGTLLTFSDGARACLGRKFAQSEYIAFLTGLLQDFTVELGSTENAEEVKDMLDRASAGKVTLAPLRGVKLRLQRRSN